MSLQLDTKSQQVLEICDKLSTTSLGLEVRNIRHKKTLENIKKYNIDISKFDSLLSLRDFIHKLKVKDYQELHKDKKKEYEKAYMKSRYEIDKEFRKQKSENSSKYNKKKRVENNNGQIRKPGRPKKLFDDSILI